MSPLNSFTTPQMVEWFAGLPSWLAFAVGGKTSITADRSVDADGCVAMRAPDGMILRRPLAEVRYWPLWQAWPGAKRSSGGLTW